jgi:phosphoribosylaminoimidazole carboxylase PurE protein
MPTESSVTPAFREQVEKGLGCAVILAGSGSDDAHIEKITSEMQKYGIPFEVRVASAHKQPVRLQDVVNEYDTLRGPLVYIAVAGGTDALSGTSSFSSFRPTISCPPDSPNQSCLTNPPGSSNAYITRPANVAQFVAQMFAWTNPPYKVQLEQRRNVKIIELEEADRKLRTKYAQLQGVKLNGS